MPKTRKIIQDRQHSPDDLFRLLKALPAKVGAQVDHAVLKDPRLIGKMNQAFYVRLQQTIFVVDCDMEEPEGQHALIVFTTPTALWGYVLTRSGKWLVGSLVFDNYGKLRQLRDVPQ